jgi:hypothetical protein
MIQPSLTNRIAIIECSLKHFDSHFDHSQTDREKGYYIISPIQHFFAKIFILPLLCLGLDNRRILYNTFSWLWFRAKSFALS